MQCKKCQKEIDVKYNRQYICRDCYLDRQKRTSNKKKKYLYDYLSSHPCEHCWEDRPVVLEFHHTNAEAKEYSVSSMCSMSLEKIISEIEKCQVLCCNCHKIVTSKELWWYSFLNLPEMNE